MALIEYKKANLDNKRSQNVQNIRWSYKLYRENLENLESGIDSRRESFTETKIQKGIFKEMHHHHYYL